MRVVATTRRQVLDVPIGGPRIAIELLSEDQQMAIARAQSGDVGIKIVDDAWRTSDVRQLVATPLYLSVLLGGASRSVHPTTKEEVLRLFVEQHEYASEHPTRYDPHHAQAHGCKSLAMNPNFPDGLYQAVEEVSGGRSVSMIHWL